VPHDNPLTRVVPLYRSRGAPADAGRTYVRYPGHVKVDGAAARELGDRDRPVSLAREQRLAVLAPLAGLFPDGGLRRGSTVVINPGGRVGGGATSLAFALMVAASQAGSWCAAVGLSELGPVAAAGLGVCLERLALVPDPGDQWPVVTAALLDAVDLVLVRPPWRSRLTDTRRLAARARERGAVLLPFSGSWPDGADLRLAVAASAWQGLGEGHGHLQARAMEVTASGRGAAARERRVRMWLPGPDGRLAAIDENGLVAAVGPAEEVPAPVPVAMPVAMPAAG
jgi:hypothetical protein